MTEIKKRQPRRTATVNYYDPITGEFITSELITAAPFVKWGKIAEIQKLILELYVETPQNPKTPNLTLENTFF